MADFGGIDISIDGFDEVQAMLDGMRTKGAELTIRKGLRRGARVVQGAIQERAPVRVPGKSGTALPVGALAADINIGNVRKLGNGDAYSISIGPGKQTAHVAGWVEYGHESVHGGRSGKGTTSQDVVSAYPFIRPAFEASKDEATAAVIETIEEDVQKTTEGKNVEAA